MTPTRALIDAAEKFVDRNYSLNCGDLRAAIVAAKAAEEGVESKPVTEWNKYQQVLRYEARRVLDPANDPDCVAAWRNGHGSIDFMQHEGCGQVPIYALRCRNGQIEEGDWIIRWEGQTCWGWVEADDRARKRFNLPPVIEVREKE